LQRAPRHRLLQENQVEMHTGNLVFVCHLHDRLLHDCLYEYGYTDADANEKLTSSEFANFLPFSLFVEMILSAIYRKECDQTMNKNRYISATVDSSNLIHFG